MTTISDPANPLATSINAADVFLFDQVDGSSVTGYRTKRATGAMLAAIPLVIGAFVQANSYTAGATGADLLMTRGTLAAATTDGVATGIFQAVANVASGSGECLYASMIKLGTTALVDYHAVYGEVVDSAGGAGSSIAGGRFTASLLVGTDGNATGVTAVGIATVPYAYLFASEGQTYNDVTDATTTFSSSAFEAGFLVSNAGTKKSFAAIMTNPVGTSIPWINGLYVASGTVQSAIVRSDATSAFGIDFTRATFTTAPYQSTGAAIDPSGNFFGVSYGVAGTKVVGARATGWTVMTGTPQRGTFTTAGVTLPQLAGVVMALEQDLIAHGLIGT